MKDDVDNPPKRRAKLLISKMKGKYSQMPTFKLNKLVRDKLPAIYKALEQKALTRKLSKTQLSKALVRKIIEETSEITDKTSKTELIGEIADVQQVLDDLKSLHGISNSEVAEIQAKKKAKKGGFSQGIFVETLTLADGDKWVDYYRAEPKRFPEVKE